MARPLASEPTRDSEIDRLLARPFVSELARVNEATSCLISESCTPKLEVNPSELVKALPMPLSRDVAVDKEPPKDLARPFVSEPARDSEPVSVLKY